MKEQKYHFPVTPQGRVSLPSPQEMTPAQRRIYDDVVKGPRGRMVGPLRAAIHSPELADRWQKLGAFLRYDTVLPHRLNELAIIICARHWNSDVEWAIHSKEAAKGGLSASVIASIAAGEDVAFADIAEQEIFDFTQQLLEFGQVSDEIYSRVKTRWSDQGIVELTALVGYYSMVAMMLNAHLVPIPDGEGPGMQQLTRLGVSACQP